MDRIYIKGLVRAARVAIQVQFLSRDWIMSQRIPTSGKALGDIRIQTLPKSKIPHESLPVSSLNTSSAACWKSDAGGRCRLKAKSRRYFVG